MWPSCPSLHPAELCSHLWCVKEFLCQYRWWGLWTGQALSNFSMILWILGRFLLPKAGATAGIASGWVSLAFTCRSDQLSSPPKLVPSFLMPLPLSFHDCTSSQRSQTPSQLPSSWDLHPLPLATVCGMSPLLCWPWRSHWSFTQCPRAHSMPCSRPPAVSTAWFSLALPAGLGMRQEAEHKPALTVPRLPNWQATVCVIFCFSAPVGAPAGQTPSLPRVASSCTVLWAWVIELCSHT